MAIDLTGRRENQQCAIEPPWPEQGRAVVVVAGAGARGAYEAGVLAELLPALFPAGLEDVVLVGASAGAVNAALWAERATPGRPLAEIGDEVCEFWTSLSADKVYAPIPIGLLTRVLRLEWMRGRVASIFDTAPLRSVAKSELKAGRIQRNLDQKSLAGVGLVVTTCPSDGSGGRTRVFMQRGTSVGSPRPDETSAMDYIDVELTHEHVLASAAIPIAFPPVHVATPAQVAGYYCDGGVRLNTPIKLALGLWAKRLVVVTSHATVYPEAGKIDERRDIVDGASQLIHALLTNGIVEDLRALRRINRLVDRARRAGFELVNDVADPPTPYLEVPFMCVAPAPGQLARIAHEVFTAPTAGTVRNYRRLEYLAVRAAFAGLGRGAGNDELLSYFLFDKVFASRQIDLGRQDARDILDRLARVPKRIEKPTLSLPQH